MRFSRIRRTFKIETLETRRMFDGDISAFKTNGVLTLIGDAAANAVAITNTSDGVIELIGLNTTANATVTPTTINGHSSQFFLNVTSIVVNFNGGATGVNKGNDAVVLTNLTLTGSVSIQLGDGNDFVGLGNFDNSTNLVDSAVNTLLGPVTAKNGLFVNLQGGNNTLLAKNLTVQGSVGLNMAIAGGDGNDTFKLQNTVVYHAASITDNGAATITIDQFAANNLSLTLGVGNDLVSISHTTITFTLNIATGFGNDTVTLDHDGATTLQAALAAGNDQLTMTNCAIVVATTIDAGTGNDAVTLNTDTLHPLNIALGVGDDSVTLTSVTSKATVIGGGDGADTITATGLHAAKLSIFGAAGNDQITLNNSTATQGIGIDAGAGADTVTLSNLICNSLGVALGFGNDSLTITTATVAGATNIGGGDGTDSVMLDALSSKTLNIILGAGADAVSLEDVSILGAAFIGGGLGADTYTNLGGNTFGSFTHMNIESMIAAVINDG